MADQVDSMIAQIAAASMQQAEAARQSSESVDAINQLGEDSAASIAATNAIVESVEHGSKRLQEHIGKFRLEETHAAVRSSLSPLAFARKPATTYGDEDSKKGRAKPALPVSLLAVGSRFLRFVRAVALFVLFA
jgi:methyl-accepting chemotaxis protein